MNPQIQAKHNHFLFFLKTSFMFSLSTFYLFIFCSFLCLDRLGDAESLAGIDIYFVRYWLLQFYFWGFVDAAV